MLKINDNFRLMPESYLFSEVAHRLAAFREANPDVEVIRMDIGDVSRPIFPVVANAMHAAVDMLADAATFKGYGPEQGWGFLRDAIAEGDYRSRGINITSDEVFVSDGAKSDLGNLGDIFSRDAVVAVPSPGYPVYTDANIIDGRGASMVRIPADEQSGFRPRIPDTKCDVIYICSPSNPTGVAMTRYELSRWIDYALANNSLIIFDSAYEAYISSSDIPRSIYEVEGAERVAIEIRSFSKTAGFTGVRCGYTVVPKALAGVAADGSEIPLNQLWRRRQSTKFNGASFIAQCGAAALYTPEGRSSIRESVEVYMRNARMLRDAFSRKGFKVFGGEDSPYVWVKGHSGMSSWEMFDSLLKQCAVSSTPGSGFGPEGEGYLRFTGFNTPELTARAAERVKGWI